MISFDRVLVANRGEIARRIIRTCRQLSISTVAVFSDADESAAHVSDADQAIRLPGSTARDTYLNGALLIQVAIDTGCAAIHPGYGFLSEDPLFAQRVGDAGLCFIGPSPSAIAAMGGKINAKRLMRAAGVPVLPDNTVESLEQVGLPALVKASAGGGGRGMRIVESATEMDEAIAAASREAEANFGDGAVFVERYLPGSRHIEVQVFADNHGHTVSLFERDCTLQRRHQKIVEESPSPVVDEALRQRMGAAAVAAAEAVDYRGAGTIEFLLDRSGAFYFLEMNTRLQVEHPVTELITGLDLVELQLLVADGQPLPERALRPQRSGHAIEVRLCAEDPFNDYAPSLGRFERVDFGTNTGVRIDSGVIDGSTISPYYDSMIAKIIGHGPSRAAAARRVKQTLEQATIVGPLTNRRQLIDLMDRLVTIDDQVDTTWLDRSLPVEPAHPADQIAAAAIAVCELSATVRPVQAGIPAGWRNNRTQPQRQTIGTHMVEFTRNRYGTPEAITVDGHDIDSPAPAETIVIVGDTVYFAQGFRNLPIANRFPIPDGGASVGSAVAPIPGVVVRTLIAVGDTVVVGQPMVVLEAMKMEHVVGCPIAGVVAELLVQPGQQLDAGQLIVRIDP